jgi:hypothetical protein
MAELNFNRGSTSTVQTQNDAERLPMTPSTPEAWRVIPQTHQCPAPFQGKANTRSGKTFAASYAAQLAAKGGVCLLVGRLDHMHMLLLVGC